MKTRQEITDRINQDAQYPGINLGNVILAYILEVLLDIRDKQ